MRPGTCWTRHVDVVEGRVGHLGEGRPRRPGVEHRARLPEQRLEGHVGAGGAQAGEVGAGAGRPRGAVEHRAAPGDPHAGTPAAAPRRDEGGGGDAQVVDAPRRARRAAAPRAGGRPAGSRCASTQGARPGRRGRARPTGGRRRRAPRRRPRRGRPPGGRPPASRPSRPRTPPGPDQPVAIAGRPIAIASMIGLPHPSPRVGATYDVARAVEPGHRRGVEQVVDDHDVGDARGVEAEARRSARPIAAWIAAASIPAVVDQTFSTRVTSSCGAKASHQAASSTSQPLRRLKSNAARKTVPCAPGRSSGGASRCRRSSSKGSGTTCSRSALHAGRGERVAVVRGRHPDLVGPVARLHPRRRGCGRSRTWCAARAGGAGVARSA